MVILAQRTGEVENLGSQAVQADRNPHEVTVSVVMPCLNEAENVVQCVSLANEVLAKNGIEGEVIVADNGSDDGSPALAAGAGAHVVHQPLRGYGNAYHAGFAAARGNYIIMGDADRTYDFREIPNYLSHLEDGADLVMGNRMANIEPGAMPWLHRYIGNPVMTLLLRILFRPPVRDVWCGMRGLRREALPVLGLRAPGMEFALEMIIRASKEGLRIDEIPITLHQRGGTSKISTFRDGWRALRLMLLYNATYLFIVPGLLIAFLGVFAMVTVLTGLDVLGRPWFIHTLIGGSLLVMAGVQVIGLGTCARTFAALHMKEPDPLFRRLDGRVRLEHGLVAAVAFLIAGLGVGGWVVGEWANLGFGALSEVRLAVVAATLVMVGVEVFFTSFLLSVLALGHTAPQVEDHKSRAHVDRGSDFRNLERSSRVV